jgi:hypothetical protein
MGRLVPTGFESEGHKFDFEYKTGQSDIGCQMVCICGWETDINSFQHPWSVIEVKVKANQHLAKFGITSYHPACIFDVEGKDNE